MQVHLVDATYELFRAHFSPRPPVLGREGVVLSGVSGLVGALGLAALVAGLPIEVMPGVVGGAMLLVGIAVSPILGPDESSG